MTAGTAAAFIAGGLIAAYALWYTSAGRFPSFPPIQNDYVDLGDSFLRGELSLQEQPDPRLALLGNPFDFNQRKGIPYHWDASYYDNKYYLYWGPAPALISSALEAMAGTPPAGSVLVVIAYIGLLIIACLLLFQIADAFGAGQRDGAWLFLLIGFVNLPMLYTIGQPRHYQASILFGQLFLLGGLLGFALYARSHRGRWLIASGLGWGLAFASRYNLALSIGIYVIFALIWLWRDRARAAFSSRLGMLVAPLGLCLVGLGLYNLARFGNVLETGLGYQLTIPGIRQLSYSPAYIPSGLYAYLLYPLTSAQTFPFIQAAHFRPQLMPSWLYAPADRTYDQVIFGLIRTVPAMWLLVVVPLFVLLIARGRVSAPERGSGLSTGWLFAMLALGTAGQVGFLLVFFYIAERYIVDFIVPLVLCLAIVVWWADRLMQKSRGLRVTLWTLVTLLTLWTAAIAYFGCFGVPSLVSNFYDSGMLASLAGFWNAHLPAARLVVSGLP